MKPSAFGVLLASAALSGCQHTTHNPNLPTGEAAYALIPSEIANPTEYFIRPMDVLSIRVFNESGLSDGALKVNEVGQIQLPLVGSLKAEGKTVAQLSDEIAARLKVKYLVDPQVSVSVKEAAPRYASVEGEVKKPGVYEIDNQATLLSTIARAESPTTTARLSETIVFRTINGQRMVARFNLKDIRTGVSPDPRILDGDTIMIGYSSTRGLVDDVLRAAPLFNAWSRF